MATTDEVRAVVRRFILDEFLDEADAAELGDTTPLITDGIIDSMATLRLVSLLEEHYGIEFEAEDVDADHFDTIAQIADLVIAKLPPA